MIIKKTLKGNIGEILEKIKQNIKNEGFKVSYIHEVSESLKKAGKNIGFKAYIVEFCNPELAHKVLNINKDMLNFMPCKIVLYEEKDNVILSSFLPIDYIEKMENNEIKIIGQEVMKKINKIIDIN